MLPLIQLLRLLSGPVFIDEIAGTTARILTADAQVYHVPSRALRGAVEGQTVTLRR